MHWAAALNQPDLARELIDLGANVEAALVDDGKPLSDRLSQSLKKVALDLQFSRKGYLPSHIAVIAHATEVLTALFAADAEVDSKANNNGYTPLHAAAGRNVAAILITHGADIRAKAIDGQTLPEFATATNAHAVMEIPRKQSGDR